MGTDWCDCTEADVPVYLVIAKTLLTPSLSDVIFDRTNRQHRLTLTYHNLLSEQNSASRS